MAEPQKKSVKARKPTTLGEIELAPDAWKRFETFVTKNVPNRPAATAKRKPSRAKTTTAKRRRKA